MPRTPKLSDRARLLQGLITDESGDVLVVSHATKGKVRYHYYGRRPREAGDSPQPPSPALRLPAHEIEHADCEELAVLFADPIELATRAGLALDAGALPQLEQRSAIVAGKLRERDQRTVRALLSGLRVMPYRFELLLNRADLAEAFGLHAPAEGEPVFNHGVALRLTRTGRAMRLVQDNGEAVTPPQPTDTQALVRLLARARQWWNLLRDTGLEIKVLAVREGVTASYMTRVVRLAFLSPKVVEAAMHGRLRTGIAADGLLAPGFFPAEWAAQERLLLAPAGA